MDINAHQEDFPEVQAAIYRVALSLDSLLVNGISIGVICRDVFNSFLQKTSSDLLEDVGEVSNDLHRMLQLPLHPEVTEVLGTLRARCQQLIDLVTVLRTSRALPLQRTAFFGFPDSTPSGRVCPAHSGVGRLLWNSETVLSVPPQPLNRDSE